MRKLDGGNKIKRRRWWKKVRGNKMEKIRWRKQERGN